MLFSKDKLQEIVAALNSIIERIYEFENKYESQLNNVHPNYSYSAKNLVHYLAMRSFNINVFQQKLEDIGLPITLESQDNILYGLLNFRTVINSLMNINYLMKNRIFLITRRLKKFLKKIPRHFLEEIRNKRKTAILVTQPTEAATDEQFIKSLLKQGMDCARINCAHDDEIFGSK